VYSRVLSLPFAPGMLREIHRCVLGEQGSSRLFQVSVSYVLLEVLWPRETFPRATFAGLVRTEEQFLKITFFRCISRSCLSNPPEYVNLDALYIPTLCIYKVVHVYPYVFWSQRQRRCFALTIKGDTHFYSQLPSNVTASPQLT